MYAVIDRASLKFLNLKHNRLDVITDLVWLECTSEHVHIFDVYAPAALSLLTDMEMMMLYKNATGEPKAPRLGNALRMLLLELASRIPERNIPTPHILRLQADKVGEDSSERFIYNPSGMTALPQTGLFNPEVTISRAENETLTATQPLVRPAQAARPVVATQTPNVAGTLVAAGTGLVQPWLTAPAKPAVAAGASNPDIVSPWLKK